MISALKKKVRSVLNYLPSRLQKKRRAKSLSAQRTHHQMHEIERALDAMPIPNGAVVLVHSSLKAIGFVEGGPQAVIQAFVNSVVEKRKGTLLFPTYTMSGSMHDTLARRSSDTEITFDVTRTPSNLGAIPEAFRKWPGVVRSVHPTHSFGALGPLANEMTVSHHTCGSSFGKGSPMAKMLDHDSWLLGLGTNLGNVTMYHCLEEIEDDFPFNVYTADSPLPANCKDWYGKIHTLQFNAHDGGISKTRIDRPENRLIRNFFTRQFEERAGLSWHQVCQAKTWLIPACEFYGESASLMRKGITIYTSESQLGERDDNG